MNGTGFVGSSVVKFNGNSRTTTFVSATQVKASILAGDIASTGTPSIAVANPTPGGGTSNSVTFTITQANNPAPTITTLQPSSATAGSAGFTLIVNGTGFVNTSVVNFSGGARTTTFVSDTQLTAAILASDITSAGTPTVTVTSPAPVAALRTQSVLRSTRLIILYRQLQRCNRPASRRVRLPSRLRFRGRVLSAVRW